MGISSDKGRITIRFKDPNGNRVTLYPGLSTLDIDDQLKAKEFEIKIQQDIRAGTFDWSHERYKVAENLTTANLTTAEAFNLFVATKSLDPQTRGLYNSVVFTLKACNLDKINIRQFSEQQAFQFLTHCQQKNLKSSTIQAKIKRLKAAWEWFIQRGLVANNPWTSPRKSIKTEKPLIQPFEREEIQLIIQGFNGSSYQPMVRFLFGSGVRIGEAIGLRWQDLSPDCATCTISSQISQGKRKPPKNGSVRSFGLTDNLQKMLSNQPKQAESVFLNHAALPIKPSTFRVKWKDVLANCGIEYRKPYSCRHTFISHALQSGVPAVTIARITGHDLETLFTYYAGFLKTDVQLPTLY
ncbi:putative Integrase family protein [Planktothrix serta PCC 8927]|uniref:Integrase family protein n=1 Tax=Planktothrix serta PCC 8927 TaxID=671068 RepID=A0A7Z9BKB6_9CYAN|nr:site-specific integrase [Planktothrix serta]VXD15962.1 putative Integrase family protein [Planktothrix serta PCC 8927]